MNVVVNRLIKQHRILWHDPDSTTQALLGHLGNRLIIDQNSTLVHVVEAKQQPCQCGFAGAGRTNNRNFVASGNFKTHVMQNGTICLVGKTHSFKPYCRLRDRQGLCAWFIFNFYRTIQQFQYQVHIRQRIFQHAIDNAQEV